MPASSSRVGAMSLPPQLPPPEFAKSLGGEMEADALALVRRVGPLAIASPADLQQAALDRQAIGAALKKIDDFFSPFCDLAYKLHRALTARRAELKVPLEAIDAKLSRAITVYKAEQDRLRREEEQRLAEVQRQEEQARLASEAAALEAAGDVALAESVLQTALEAPAPVVVLPDATKGVEGLSFRKVWKWRYVRNDPARAMELIPREYLTVDESRVSKVVTALKDQTRIPGIEVYCEDVPVRR